MEVIKNYPLARHTTWRVGGFSDWCYRPQNATDLVHILQTQLIHKPITFLGLGSNVLIRDGGIRGTVFLLANRLNQIESLSPQLIRVEAGVTCAKLAKFSQSVGWILGAFFAGIPGTVGGALVMNAGAFGGQTWDHVAQVETIDFLGTIRHRSPQDFEVTYRSVVRPSEEYFLAAYFNITPNQATPEQVRDEIRSLIHKRNRTQPIGLYSAGSVFKNPSGYFAARLIEEAGCKGYRMGCAEVSQKHANFIINLGKATAVDIERLMEEIQMRVYNQFGVQLVSEIHMLGDQ